MSLLGSAMAGDIWSTGAFSFESPLKELLDAGNYTIEQLLAEDELLQELRGVHPELIQFFSTEEAVTSLVRYVILPFEQTAALAESDNGENTSDGETADVPKRTNKPREPGEWLNQHIEQSEAEGGKLKAPEKDPELKHIRFPYMACEIICCEIQPIIDILVDGMVPDSRAKAKVADSEEAPAAEETKGNEQEEKETNDTSAEEEKDVSSQEGTRILELLFSVLYETKPGEMDDYRAGYLEKILTVLFRRRPEELSKFINEGGSRGTEVMMKTTFSHLYSHSIMQIAQRLMLPQRPTPPQLQCDETGAEIMSEEQGMIDEDPGVMCDWSKSSLALDMLLDSLIEPHVPSTFVDENELEERRLDLSLNASEVLITVIQNSMLSSETMLSLTSVETIQRLVDAATQLREEKDGEPYFSPHESLLTSAMNVLESLILQLGGYGAVGTMLLLPEEEENYDGESGEPNNLIADLSSMVSHLPQLLTEMAKLLKHPSTTKWLSPMQFSKKEPQKILGSSRLRIVRVLESLVLLGDPEVDSKLVQSDCLEICLDLFWEFQWCSMLHQSVANLLVHVFEGQNARIQMQEFFLIRCNLLSRLMDSFLEIQDGGRIANVVMDMNKISTSPDDGVVSSAASEHASESDPLPVSEDDVEAVLEKQEAEMVEQPSTDKDGGLEVSNVEQVSTEAVRFESRDASTIGMAAPSQSFRFGYMGHVIIICQALVHACSNEIDEDQMQYDEDGNLNTESGDTREQNEEPLLLAELVANHSLAEAWNDFVESTLATETEIQSTPLGGYDNAGPEHDALHTHRPGPDDGDMGDDGMGPPAPPRGMLGGGDTIDMDDNDLDIAASMMAGLNLQRHVAEGSSGDSTDSGSLESGDSEKSYNSGETANERTGYAFDDPLGKAGGLGIELGKLTQYQGSDGDEAAANPDSRGDEDEDDDNSSSSSDEAETAPGSSGSDVPVMDLFAGNFNYNQEESPDIKNAQIENGEEWSNFANFEHAEEISTSAASEPVAQDGSGFSSRGSDIEEIFGKGDHSNLLETEETVADSQEPVVGASDGIPENSTTETEERTASAASEEKDNGPSDHASECSSNPVVDPADVDVPEEKSYSEPCEVTSES